MTLDERRKQSMEVGQIDNGMLMAGSPMYYYCKYCGVLSDTKPEDWWEVMPKTVCDDCQVLLDAEEHDKQCIFPPYSNHDKR